MGRLRRKFDFLADISSKFPDDKKPILVGGSAVELYTRGRSQSEDLDLIADWNTLVPMLLKMGFKAIGRHFYKYPNYVEIPSDTLVGRSSKIIKYRNKKIRVISVEDLIIDRLCACKFWKSAYDCEQAKMLQRGYSKKIDREYLNARAKEEDVLNLL
jgi:hypothetical protein